MSPPAAPLPILHALFTGLAPSLVDGVSGVEDLKRVLILNVGVFYFAAVGLEVKGVLHPGKIKKRDQLLVKKFHSIRFTHFGYI